MKVFTVHEPAGLKSRGDAAARRVVFVKEGFCWPALLIAPVWLIYNRMWLVLLGFLGASVAVAGLEQWLEPSASMSTLVEFALLLLFALEANNLRRWKLRRRGYRMRTVVAGADREGCEAKFFALWLDEAPGQASLVPYPGTGPAPPPAPRGAPRAPSGVIGMFPEPGDR